MARAKLMRLAWRESFGDWGLYFGEVCLANVHVTIGEAVTDKLLRAMSGGRVVAYEYQGGWIPEPKLYTGESVTAAKRAVMAHVLASMAAEVQRRGKGVARKRGKGGK